jgi:hypothetical protein
MLASSKRNQTKKPIGFLSVNTQDQNQINWQEKGNGKTADTK